MIYTEKVMEIFRNPKHVGELKDANAIGEVGNIVCGDIMRVYLKINEKTRVIEDATFETFGCTSAIASSSIALDMIIGKTIEEALAVKNEDIVNALGTLPPQKIHCSVLATEAIADAVKKYDEAQAKKKAKAAKRIGKTLEKLKK